MNSLLDMFNVEIPNETSRWTCSGRGIFESEDRVGGLDWSFESHIS